MSFALLHVTTVSMSLTFLRGQVAFMKERGVRVHVVSSPGPELEEFTAREGVTVSAVEMSRRITPLQDLVAITRLVRELSRVRPVIVHAHTPKGGLLGMIAAAVRGVPVRVYHLRGLPLMGATGWKRRLLWTTEWLACALAQQVFCVSASVCREAVAQGICPVSKIKVLLGGSGNGVDARGRFDPGRLDPGTRERVRERLGIPTGATVVGYVGRIVRDKGVVELVQAWSELRETHPDLHLLIVGPFEPQDPVPEAVARRLREDPRIHPVGLDWNTPPLYTAMDVVALPSYREGFPNVPLEAAAMELAVVATRIPGCVDAVVDGCTGTLVPPRDAAALRDALQRYLEDPDLRRRHGRAARARVLADFEPEAIWSALFEEYQRLLRQRGRMPPTLTVGDRRADEVVSTT